MQRDQPRRCARTPSRGFASTTSTSPACPCSTPTSRPTAAGASRPPSRRSAPASATPTASSSPRPSPLKNALDWASRGVNCWADKPAAIVCAGGNFGGGRSSYQLRQVGVFLDIHFINKPELFVFAFSEPDKFFDGDGNLIHAETRERLKQVLLSLQAFTLRLQRKD
uniref:NAD(P)H dehydrogenase (quinone) n=1 Tax=Setaria italica TaxID=4555 RepID=K4AG05_SETIT